MQPHTHGHVYRNEKEADRIIQMFGRKPSEQKKLAMREVLAQEKDRFLALEKLRSQQQERQRGRGR